MHNFQLYALGVAQIIKIENNNGRNKFSGRFCLFNEFTVQSAGENLKENVKITDRVGSWRNANEVELLQRKSLVI